MQWYPSNINRSRCCDQVICTECFVQIKRTEPTVTHMVSEPACCPFCVQEHFGVIYTPPFWRTGIGCEGWVCLLAYGLAYSNPPHRYPFCAPFSPFQPSPTWPDSPKDSQRTFDSMKARAGKQKRFKSLDHTDADVVTVGMYHHCILFSKYAASSHRESRSDTS